MKNNITNVNFLDGFDGSFYQWNLHSNLRGTTLYQDIATHAWYTKKNNDNDCEYKTNFFGFRSEEFKKGDVDSLFLGCSETFGSGGPVEDTWAHILYNKKNIVGDFINLGIPGSGWSENIYNAFVYMERYGIPKNIFLLLPNIERKVVFDYPQKIVGKNTKNLYDKNKEKGYYMWWFPVVGSNDKRFPKKYKLDSDDYKTIFKERYQDISTLSKVCKILKINLIWSSWADNEQEMFGNINDLYQFQFPGFVNLNFNYYKDNYFYPALINNKNKTLDKYDGHRPVIWHEFVADMMYNKFIELENNK